MSLPPLSKVIEDDDKYTQQLAAESALKPGDKPEDTLNIHRGVIRVPSPDPSLISIDDSNNIRLGRNLDYVPTHNGHRHASHSPAPPRGLKGRVQVFWIANKGLALVLISQLFGTLMNVTTRMLEMEGNDGRGYHPFQILFARMGITALCSSAYMWHNKTEHFPFGMREVRSLLVARGLFGFFGVFGMYYSLLYLPLADATVITFLAPSLACWACSYLIHEPFTRMEQIAAYVSLFGVVLIARPVSLFTSLSHSDEPVPPASGDSDFAPSMNGTNASPDRLAAEYDSVTPAQRATAVGIAMLGVIGAAGAYTTIRWIGKRAHPLISVNYFATWCTIVSVVAMLAVPGVGFLLPRYLKDWCYLIFLGICGFVMQFLLAAGLQYEKSSRATNMVYMQMLFALAFDKLVWGTTPGALSIVGSSLILGSAIYVAMNKEHPNQKVEPGGSGDSEEGRGLMSTDADEQRRDDDGDILMRPMR
ncbi:Nn.00g061490.m01.CDS01 [Neocucurbitaria sp. VM-36]